MSVGSIASYSANNLYYLAQVQLKNKTGSATSSAETLLDDGGYNLAATTGIGSSGVMLFTDSFASGSTTGTTGTMLDYFA